MLRKLQICSNKRKKIFVKCAKDLFSLSLSLSDHMGSINENARLYKSDKVIDKLCATEACQ